jgi:hypothetical protein
MTDYERPSVPTAAADIEEELAAKEPSELRGVAQYAEALAEHLEREERLDKADQGDEGKGDRPPSVPDKAGVTVKEIDGRRYEYYQWRDGDSVKSQYKGVAEED